MASETVSFSATNTLSSTTVDTITFNTIVNGKALIVTNYDATNTLGVTTDGTTPVADGNDCYQCPPASTLVLNGVQGGNVVKVIGNGGKYTLQLAPLGSAMTGDAA